MVAAPQSRTPFGEPIRRPPQTPQQRQSQQLQRPITSGAAAGGGTTPGGGLRNVGTGMGVSAGQSKPGGPGTITRKPLAQLQPQKPSTEKKKKCFGGGCCKAKKKPGVQKAAPPKSSSKRRPFSSLFSRKKKSTDGAAAASLRSSKPTTTSKGLTPRYPRMGNRPIGQPSSAAAATAKQQQQQQLTNRSSSTSAAQTKPQQQAPRKKQTPLGTRSSKSLKDKSDKKKVKKVSSPKMDATQKSLEESKTQQSEKELRTGREDSIREIKKPKNKAVKKSSSGTSVVGKDRAYEKCKSFQEVKVCVASFDNGMVERKVMMTSVYPQNEAPPKQFIPCVGHHSQGKKSYTSLKRANSTDRLPPPPERLSPPEALPPPERLASSLPPQSPKEDSLKSPEKPPPPSNAVVALRESSAVAPAIRVSSASKLLLPHSPSHYPSTSYRERALSTIIQLREHYELTQDEIRILSKNPDLKETTVRAGLALQEAQQNLRNLKILAGKHLLPDLSLFSDELSVVILELDRFIDAIQTVSEHAEERTPPKQKQHKKKSRK